MIVPTPKPPSPLPNRLPKRRPQQVTLIAAFRCRDSGVLLCADREENDGYSKREVDKIFRSATYFLDFELFLAGAGPSTATADAWREINEELFKSANQQRRDAYFDHRTIIENSLKTIHDRHKRALRQYPLRLLIVFAPRGRGLAPFLYKSDRSTLIEEDYYAAFGTGQALSDYFSGYLYKYGQEDEYLAVIAAFILREAEKTASGVGLGNDMIFIHPNGALRFLHKESVAEIQAGIPNLKEAIHSDWAERLKVPAWLKQNSTPST